MLAGGEPRGHAWPDLVRRQRLDAVRCGEAAGVETGLVGAGPAVDPGGARMLRGEERGQLRAEDGERGHAEQRGEVAGTRIVADEAIGVGERVEQAVHVAERIVEQGHRPAGGFEPAGDLLETLDGPLAHGLTGAGVYDHAVPAGRCEAGDFRREAPVEFAGQRMPVFGAMRERWWRQRARQEQPGPGARKAEPRGAAGQRQ